MLIVMKDGPKKGEIQEMKFAVARDLINLGRAERYSDEAKPLSPQEIAVVADDPSPEASKSKKKKGKK